MQTEDLIPANEFCLHYQIEFSFIESLEQSGLIKIITIGETGYIEWEQLPEIEKWIRLNHELNINLEGIEALSHLLQRIKNMQAELNSLKNRLRLYENPD